MALKDTWNATKLKVEAANLLFCFLEICATGLDKLPLPEWFLLIKVEAPQGHKWSFLLGKRNRKALS